MVIIIQGPTGSGKTNLAYSLAKELDTDLISADSRQVYRYADIGTNKERFSDVITHLIDIRDPNEEYNAFAFKEDALNLINRHEQEGKHSIVVGGTAFYIDVLTGKRSLQVTDAGYRDHEERVRVTYNDKPLAHLQQTLAQYNNALYQSLNNSELHNRQRLIRKIAQATYDKPLPTDTHALDIPVLKIGIRIDKNELQESIEKRTHTMIEQGLEEEVTSIYKRFGKESTVLQTIGYMEWLPYFSNDRIEATKKQEADIIHDIYTHTMQYSKRQMTWLKKDRAIEWYEKRNDLSNKVISEVIKKVNR